MRRLAPGGLSIGGCTAELAQLTDMCDYMGHAFSSDTEGMQYPVLPALYPGPARSVLTFREAGLPQAIQKAQSLGYAGALFPWEAGQSGSDQLLITDRDQPSAKLHVGGDGYISRAIMNYYLATRDKAWLKESGYPMSLEIARFFANRFVPCTESTRRGKFCMNEVMGPENWSHHWAKARATSRPRWGRGPQNPGSRPSADRRPRRGPHTKVTHLHISPRS